MAEKNATSVFACTVSDAITVDTTVYYLFVLTSKTVGNKEYKFLAEDTSDYPERYNKFTVTEGPAGDFNAPAGDYYYKIIQKETATTSYNANNVILEQGILRLVNDNPVTTGSYSYLKNYGAKK